MLTKLGQLGLLVGQFLRHQRAERRDTGSAPAAGSRCAGSSVARPWSPSLVLIERMIARWSAICRASFGRCSLIRMPGTRGRDRLERAAVGVARLQVERVHLAGPAVHPQQDARPLPLRIRRRVGRQRSSSSRRRPHGDPRRRQAQIIAERDQLDRSGVAGHGSTLLQVQIV